MQYNLVPVKWCQRSAAAGKVTVGLASHWPTIADSVMYPHSGHRKWDQHPAYAHEGHGTLFFYWFLEL